MRKNRATAGEHEPALPLAVLPTVRGGRAGGGGVILSDAELTALTGYKRRGAQVRWLAANGWRHAVNAVGAVIVARAEFERQLVGGKPQAAESAIRWGEVKNGRKAA